MGSWLFSQATSWSQPLSFVLSKRVATYRRIQYSPLQYLILLYAWLLVLCPCSPTDLAPTFSRKWCLPPNRWARLVMWSWCRWWFLSFSQESISFYSSIFVHLFLIALRSSPFRHTGWSPSLTLGSFLKEYQWPSPILYLQPWWSLEGLPQSSIGFLLRVKSQFLVLQYSVSWRYNQTCRPFWLFLVK